ncbi:SHOCT domain-containing protein [Bacillus sp. PS06]|uniref:SHOCT domain-containing protein n=1 Tax=Bacillus sp. PS06 TaxID=2764176 RepID=UPI001CD8444F|nr:SHOCT domain-containing protein [Bacillus sp. PS06]
MDTIQETIKLAGLGRKKAMQKQIELFRSGLMEGENLLGVGASNPKPTEQIYVTDKRIIVHKIEGIFKNEKVEIPLSSVSSINTTVKGLGASIAIVASNNKASVEKLHIHIAQELKSLIDSLLHSSSNQTASINTSVDVADQIKKLADLRDGGILTEEEFNAKKKQLLGI